MGTSGGLSLGAVVAASGKLGISEVFTPAASTDEIVEFVRGAVSERA